MDDGNGTETETTWNAANVGRTGSMSDEDIDEALQNFVETANDVDMTELLKTMNEQNVITWDEAERILSDGKTEVVKSGLPEQVRPSDPENSTNVDDCIQSLMANDSRLVEVNLNNMKRTPLIQIQKLITAATVNTYLKKLSLANTGLTDNSAEPLIDMINSNSSLTALNVETNYLTGDFLARLFAAALANQSLTEVRANNQGPTFSNQSEVAMMTAICQNRSLIKVNLTLRSQEMRDKIDKALFRNGELRRMSRLEQRKQDVDAEPMN